MVTPRPIAQNLPTIKPLRPTLWAEPHLWMKKAKDKASFCSNSLALEKKLLQTVRQSVDTFKTHFYSLALFWCETCLL